MLNTIVYLALLAWLIADIYLMFNYGSKKNLSGKSKYLYHAWPPGYTTLGILGTFFGIYLGLDGFSLAEIDTSITELLAGLTISFGTSIIGIALSIIMGRAHDFQQGMIEVNSPVAANDEVAALHELKQAIIGDSDNSLATHMIKTREKIIETNKALGGEGDSSIITQVQYLRSEQQNANEQMTAHVQLIIAQMQDNGQLMAKKFDEFSELMAKNNTEALVEVMKSATEEFNKQMSSLVEKLVKENFDELNRSVQAMNTWQQENKVMIGTLTSQFQQVSNDFAISAASIKEITGNTSKLTDDNSQLKTMIEELRNIMVDDKKFTEITDKLVGTVDTLKTNTEAFDATTNKLNDWVKSQLNFTDSVAKLMVRLEQIDQIKDINDVFWNDTKKQLTEAVTIIETASKKLATDLDGVNQHFYERLNDTLQSLDTLILRIIQKNSN